MIRKDHKRAHYNQRRTTQARDRADAERVLDYLREAEGAQSVSAAQEELAARGARISGWRLRGLLRYLVATRQVAEVRNLRPGSPEVRFRIVGSAQ